MFSTKVASLLALAFVASVNAQDTSGISPCVITCVTQAASSAGCSSFTDLTCVCTNADFQSAATSCLESTCTSEEQQAALQLQSAQCGASSASASLSSAIESGSASLSSAVESASSGLSSVTSAIGSSISGQASSLSSKLNSVTSTHPSTSGSTSGANPTSSDNGNGAFKVGGQGVEAGVFAAGLTVLGAVFGGAFLL